VNEGGWTGSVNIPALYPRQERSDYSINWLGGLVSHTRQNVYTTVS
jgi:hypothetical protein